MQPFIIQPKNHFLSIFTMKKIISFLFLFCLYAAAYGQDLIVTATGDSLRCKIVEVGNDEIQFRFDDTGNIISIKRAETASYKYNFESATTSRNVSAKSKKPVEKKTKEKPANTSSAGHRPFLFALKGGASTYGSISYGKTSGGAFVAGLDAAYFFNRSLGAGLTFNSVLSSVSFNDGFSYNDRVLFYAPSLFIRLGKGKAAFAGAAGIGGISWKMTNMKGGEFSFTEAKASNPSPVALLSAGVNYMFTERLGLNLNIYYIYTGKMKTEFERNPNSNGSTLGLVVRL